MKKFNYILNGSLAMKTFSSINEAIRDAFGDDTRNLHYRCIFKTDDFSVEIFNEKRKINILAFIPGQGYCDCFEELEHSLVRG